jgi:hypothetical protein
MKRMVLSAVVCVLTALPASAQIDMQCSLENSRTVLFEPVVVSLSIVNNTGEILDFSGAVPNAHLAFDVERSPGVLVPPTGVPLFAQVVTVKPGETFSGKVNLQSAFKITDTGPYMITTRVEWGGKVFVSPKMFLDILPGFEIGKLVAGIPEDPNAVRSYTLRTLNRDRSEVVFLRINDDDAGTCYGVFELGTIVRTAAPKLQVDEVGCIHVLHQSSPGQFIHSVFTPHGDLVAQEVYSSDGSAIGLKRAEDGQLVVEGGQRYAPASEGASGDEAPAEKTPTPAPALPESEQKVTK